MAVDLNYKYYQFIKTLCKNRKIHQQNKKDASVVGFRLASLASTTLIGVTTDSIFEQIC